MSRVVMLSFVALSALAMAGCGVDPRVGAYTGTQYSYEADETGVPTRVALHDSFTVLVNVDGSGGLEIYLWDFGCPVPMIEAAGTSRMFTLADTECSGTAIRDGWASFAGVNHGSLLVTYVVVEDGLPDERQCFQGVQEGEPLMSSCG